MEFDHFGLSVKDLQTKEEIARFSSKGDLYSLHGTPTPTARVAMTASVDLWHRRLGHPNSAIVSSLLCEFSIPCTSSPHNSSLCEACQQGKHVSF